MLRSPEVRDEKLARITEAHGRRDDAGAEARAFSPYAGIFRKIT